MRTSLSTLIVDDHVMFVAGLEAILMEIAAVEVVDRAYTAEEALEKLAEGNFQLVLTDISMPGMDGITFLRKVKSQFPNIKVVILSMHNEMHIIKMVLKHNPDAYLLKNTDSNELVAALEAIQKGGQYYCDEIKNILVDSLRGVENERKPNIIPSLSPREKEVLALIAKECTTSEIAEQLFLSLHTIETYRKNLLRKLDSKNSVGLVAKAYQFGLI